MRKRSYPVTGAIRFTPDALRKLIDWITFHGPSAVNAGAVPPVPVTVSSRRRPWRYPTAGIWIGETWVGAAACSVWRGVSNDGRVEYCEATANGMAGAACA